MPPGPRLTFLIIPEEGGRTHEYKIPRVLVRVAALSGVALLVVLAMGLHAMLESKELARQVEHLQRDKDILVEEVQRVDQLEVILNGLQASNAQLRRITAEAVGLSDSESLTRSTRVGEQLISVVDRLRYGRLRTVPTLTPVRATTPDYEGEVLVYRPPAGSLVRATAAGRVVATSMAPDGDHHLRLDHGNGLFTEYAGLSMSTIEDGQYVQKGQPLGLSHPWLGVRFTLIEDGQQRRPEIGELWL